MLTTAKQVIEQEIEGLKALEDALGQNFIDAVNLIVACKGKIVISGMGKSGHIARKIAATFASTGTPAIFVHPAEASHGDLGMITKDDAVILLSNSGETAELKDIIFYCKRFSIPIIGIVRRKTSTLVEASTIPFILPDVAEASTVAAPTTSTTMMLAFGDALAITVMNEKGFSKIDFGTFHPGGKLGSQFIKVSAIMAKDEALPKASPETKMGDALVIMTKKALGGIIAVNSSNKVLGIFTDGDLRRHINDNIVNKTLGELINKNPKTISENALAVEALGIMNKHSITSLIVCDENKSLKGFIHIHQLLSAGLSA
ncbi:MAG TPA: KpsF/GutQ family sugar-phosphate isomerase [Alphaproteobacteria bacterium]|nr:KpsF/GutQ family sugar-phosphate isomerase [Alphaproteobacteria bacterium]